MKPFELIDEKRLRLSQQIERLEKEDELLRRFAARWREDVPIDKIYCRDQPLYGTQYDVTLGQSCDSRNGDRLSEFVECLFIQLPPEPIVRYKRDSLSYRLEASISDEKFTDDRTDITYLQPWIIKIDHDRTCHFKWRTKLDEDLFADVHFVLRDGTIRFRESTQSDNCGRVLKRDFFPESDVILIDRYDRFWREKQTDFNPMVLWWYRDESMTFDDVCISSLALGSSVDNLIQEKGENECPT